MKLRVEKAIYGGAGLARFPKTENPPKKDDETLAGKAVFISYTLPGELAEAHIVEDKRGFSTAELDSVLEPSPERISPGCKYFFACGGCQYQHANAAYQLQMKIGILRDTLERAHLGHHLTSLSAIAGLAGPEWGYRNRVRLHVAKSKGSIQLCYRERGSRRNLPIMHCPIAAPLIERAITAVQQIEKPTDLARLCEQIEFFTDGEQETLLLSLWLPRNSHAPRAGFLEHELQEFCEQLQGLVPELAGAGLFSEEDGRLHSHWGRRSLVYTVADHKYQVSLGSFFQVNRFLVAKLLDLVVGSRSGKLAWDLYAGVGLFAQALNFERIIAIEVSPAAVADLKQNLAGAPHRAIQSSTLEFLRKQSRAIPRVIPDLILLDPPRAGLGNEVCTLLAQITAPAIVYVSCDPATLARDLQTLLQSGYRLQSMHMVDLFPQTFHLETVTVLLRTREP